MKKLLAMGAVIGSLLMVPATAGAEPGSANGGGWFESEQVCDGEPVTMFVHGGFWSAMHAENGNHFILVSQTLFDDRDDSVLFTLRKQGHLNQGPYVTCVFEVPEEFFGFPASAVTEGFWRP